MKESSNISYYRTGNEWKELNKNTAAPLSHQELAELNGSKWPHSLLMSEEVYVPNIQLLDVPIFRQYEHFTAKKETILGQKIVKKNLILFGDSRKCSVGKEYRCTAAYRRLLSLYIKIKPSTWLLRWVFLIPNERLPKDNILNRKGFPESYDMARLITFLGDGEKTEKKIFSPVYHIKYTISLKISFNV